LCVVCCHVTRIIGLIYFFCNHLFTPYVPHVKLSWAMCQVMREHIYSPHTNKTVYEHRISSWINYVHARCDTCL
jgi:hypothetical protein